MTASYYLFCFGYSLLGLIFSMLMQMKSLSDKAKVANVIFKPSAFFQSEWVSILLSLTVIGIGLFTIPLVSSMKPEYLIYVKPLFLPIGYMGTDFMLKIFGIVNKKINSAIDFKTTQADTASGNLDKPTPAV